MGKICFCFIEGLGESALDTVHPTKKIKKQLQKNAFASILVPNRRGLCPFQPSISRA